MSVLRLDDAEGGWDGERRGLEIVAEPDRSDKASKFLRWLLHPLEPEEFVGTHFGKRPVVISRAAHGRDYYKGVFSLGEMERQLATCKLRWTDDVDAARYQGGARTTHNGEGVANAKDAWAKFAEGCSLRLSWPQRHSDALWGVLAQLEEFFGSASGVNAYATPAGAQGFAPHYDDIDAFVLQLEGEKRWRLYAPSSAEEVLPRFSSPNLPEAELGELLADFTLRPGDLLYMPRGVVHQAVVSDAQGGHSLHVTASVGRQHAWRDLLEVGLLGALETAAQKYPEWRENLPVDLGDHLGVVHAEEEEEEETTTTTATTTTSGTATRRAPPPRRGARRWACACARCSISSARSSPSTRWWTSSSARASSSIGCRRSSRRTTARACRSGRRT